MKRYLPLAIVPLLAACAGVGDGRVSPEECAAAQAAALTARAEYEAGKVSDDTVRRLETAAALACAFVTSDP